MITSLNKKMCKPDQKIKCNTMVNNPKTYKSPLFLGMTLLFRYFFPFILGAVFISPFVGGVSIFYPFAQFAPYLHVFLEYTTEPSVMDYILMYGGLGVMIGYYYYSFNQLGAFVFLQIVPSIIISTIMYVLEDNLAWGIVLLLINIVLTIMIDGTLYKKTRKIKNVEIPKSTTPKKELKVTKKDAKLKKVKKEKRLFGRKNKK